VPQRRPLARWLGPALWVDTSQGGLLIDAPEGVVAALREQDLLDKLCWVVVSTARTHSMAGLLGLLDGLSEREGPPLHVVHLLEDARTPLLVAAWTQGWPDGREVELDGVQPGTVVELPGARVLFTGVHAAERTAEGIEPVRPVAGAVVQVHGARGTVVWVPTCRLSSRVHRAVADADLAVVQVGRRPWPATAHPWRLSVETAMQVALGARSHLLVSDDGQPLSEQSVEH
jgi:hypothetical protein